ncbi:hypothetical protein D3C72_2427060 [compost metagenome]
MLIRPIEKLNIRPKMMNGLARRSISRKVAPSVSVSVISIFCMSGKPPSGISP